jgi:uncharacterized membrane protein YphA (DoxX/SURF4 family)
MNAPKLPHHLRIVIFFLRLALGLNFLYLGIAALFNAAVMQDLHGQSFTGLYAWLVGDMTVNPWHIFFAWALLVIGGCLILGLMTRLVAIIGIVLVVMSYLPSFSTATAMYALASIDIITVLCLLIVLFSNAGAYLGLDVFIHVHLPGKHKKNG